MNATANNPAQQGKKKGATMTRKTEENNPEGSRVVRVATTSPRSSDFENLRTELRTWNDELRSMLKALTAVCATCSTSPPPTSPPTSSSNPQDTLYFTRLQIIETQVPAVEQRVRNVEKVLRDEEKGQVTHRRADVLDNSFGQLDKRVVILMRDVDSSFRNELEKMKDNEASITHRKNKKLTAMACLEQMLKCFTMDQVTLRAEMLQQIAIFCEGKNSLAQLQQRLEKNRGTNAAADRSDGHRARKYGKANGKHRRRHGAAGGWPCTAGEGEQRTDA